MNLAQRFVAWLAQLAQVRAVDVGKPDDGLGPITTAGGPMDRDWAQLVEEFKDSREAWRKNPLARRIVGLVTAYVVGGQGMKVGGKRQAVNKFCQTFFQNPENRMMLRQVEWCDELTRAGELFPTLHINPVDGSVIVRAVPASQIQAIEWRKGDYEAETYYQENQGALTDPKRWRSWRSAEMVKQSEQPEAIMLHYAVNKPIGNMRGEGDLVSILPWLKRYSRWLDDRVRLNAALRAYLWIVRVPKTKIQGIAEKYRKPPTPGSVLVVDRDNEEWQAVTPEIGAKDAEKDGRAIRWMVVAGGPGTGLTDVGEAETSNLATAEAMAEQRRRFLRQRQAYFAWMLGDIIVKAWNWGVDSGIRRAKKITSEDLIINVPDIAPTDNQSLASASLEIAKGMIELREVVGDSQELRRIAAELIFKFAGETVSDEEMDRLLETAEDDDQRSEEETDDESDNGEMENE